MIRTIAAKLPVATISVLLATGIMTGLQFAFPQILSALERTPTALANDQWWRLITPLLVHSDGWRQIAFNFPAILVLGTLIERIFGSRQFLILYLVCGLIGEIAGYAWRSYGAGASVAGAGVLGALTFWLLLRGVPGKVGGAFLLISAGILTFLRDIHGPPWLAGICIAWICSHHAFGDSGKKD